MHATDSTSTKNRKQLFPLEGLKQLCLNHGTLLKLKKNSVLFDERDMAKTNYIYYLVDGICSVSGISSTGKEQIFLYQKSGEIIGHVPHLLPGDAMSHPFAYRRPTILTKTNCLFYQILPEHFLECLHTNSEVSIYLNQQMAHNYSMALAHLKQMQEDSVVSSVCRFLLQVSVLSKEGLTVPKLFTYGEISRFLGVHEVTVSKIIGRLKQESLITRTPSGLFITDNAELEHIIRHPETFKYK